MSFKDLKITTYQDSVSALPDYPSDAGITAAQLKAVFDGRTDKEIKQKFNALIDEIITKFGLVEVDIADAVEGHNQQEDAHEKIILPMREQISDILLELLSMNIAIEGKADGLETKNQLGALDLLISGTTNELHDHTGARNNQHEVTAEQIGLGNVDNTRDADKRVFYSNESAYAEEAEWAYRAEMDYNGNVIHETYATKKEVGNVDLSEYVPREEFTLRVEPIENDIDNIYQEIGDIDTALESILAIQNELIGG
jgi:hypothetical protein